jgi:hypothetical protein
MRIPSGKLDQLIYFVAVDPTDLKTRETALSSFTVYRSRNGGAATVYTTPTVAELSAANMPGVYSLAIDEDTTIAAGSDSEEYCVHITQASMQPVTRTIELYRRDTTTGRTLAVDATFHALADVDTIKTNPVVNAGTVTFPTTATLASTTNITAAAGCAVSSIGANVITAAATATDFGDELAAAVWRDTVPGDFTVALSVGKSVMNGVALGTGLTINAYTGNTAQTGDSFARLGAPAGASVSADILVLDNFVDDLESRLGTPSNLGSGATISANLVDIEGQTNDIGVAGAGLTAVANVVWNEDATGHQTLGTFGQAIGDPVADTNTIFKAVVTDATGATIGVDIVEIETQTDDIGVAGAGLTAINLPDQTMNITGDITGNLSGSVGSVTGLTASNLDATITSRATPAQVNTEVLDVLNTDTFAEPPQELPPSTTTLVKKLGYLFKAWRNKSDQTATLYQLYNDDAATVDHKATVSDNGTTFVSNEKAAGP